MMSRRLFLALTGTAILAPPVSWSADEVPALLDHILLGCNDLDRGIAFVEERAGVRAAFGGVHPGRGTRNALLSLGERRYLEIIAPDPKQEQSSIPAYAVRQLTIIKELTVPRLVGWAAHPGEIEAFAKKLRKIRHSHRRTFPWFSGAARRARPQLENSQPRRRPAWIASILY